MNNTCFVIMPIGTQTIGTTTIPKIVQAMTDRSLSKEDQQQAFIQELGKNPDYANQFIQALFQSGIIQI